MEPAGIDDWAPATINRPFTIGDYLYTDDGAQAELHMDAAVMRMGPQTSFGFLNLNDQAVQIKLTEGDMYFRVHNFSPDQTFEVDTPNAAVTLLANGVYRFRVDPNGNTSFVVVRQGRGQVTGGGQAFTLEAGSSVSLAGTDQLSYDVEAAPAADSFDNWCVQRDAHEARLVSARYLPPTVIGYEDLDDYGGWQTASTYGVVWYPNQVEAGWSPYHNGHWAWVDPWGWTWVDDAPWGFAPFHYGRWAYISGRWGWCPGPMAIGYAGPVAVVRPYYAPALVAWFGGAHWGVGLSFGGGFGGGVSLGWVSLGFGEVYTPSYQCSPRYFQNVNVYNTRIVNTVNITNVYNTVYVNKTVYNQTFVNSRAPNAVMAMPQSAFASGRPVAQVARAVPAAQVVNNIRASAVVAPSVAPTREAVAPTLGARAAPHPPAQLMQRAVVAKATPPPAPAPFAVKQQYLQQHAGQVYNHQAMRQAVAPQVHTAALVRPAPAARTVAVHAGTKVGNPPPVRAEAARPGGAPAAAQPAARPSNQPAQPAARTTPQPAARPTTQPGQPAARTQPAAPAERGTPPNQRATKSTAGQLSRPSGTAAQPEARPAERPAPTERTAPAARTPQPPPARPEERPAPTERTAPAARTPQPPPARPEERPAPAARPAERPAPAERTAPEHGTPPARTTERPTNTTATHGSPPAEHKAPPAKEEKKNTEKKNTKDTNQQ